MNIHQLLILFIFQKSEVHEYLYNTILESPNVVFTTTVVTVAPAVDRVTTSWKVGSLSIVGLVTEHQAVCTSVTKPNNVV